MLDLSEYPFQLSKSTIDAETSSISHLISPVKFVNNVINHKSFDSGITIFDDYEDALFTKSDKTVDELFLDKVDGLRYFADKDLLLIPAKIDKYLEDSLDVTRNAVISYYNLQPGNKWGLNTVTELPDTMPKPASVKVTNVEKHYYVGNSRVFLYVDLPSNLYSSIVIPEQAISFDIDTMSYITKTKNQQQLFDRINYVAENGFDRPLRLLLNSNVAITLIDGDEEDFLIAHYLGLPSIPVVFIVADDLVRQYVVSQSNNGFIDRYPYHITRKVEPDFNKEGLNEIIGPNIGISKLMEDAGI